MKYCNRDPAWPPPCQRGRPKASTCSCWRLQAQISGCRHSLSHVSAPSSMRLSACGTPQSWIPRMPRYCRRPALRRLATSPVPHSSHPLPPFQSRLVFLLQLSCLVSPCLVTLFFCLPVFSTFGGAGLDCFSVVQREGYAGGRTPPPSMQQFPAKRGFFLRGANASAVAGLDGLSGGEGG